MLNIFLGAVAVFAVGFTVIVLWGWCSDDFKRVEATRKIRSDKPRGEEL